MVVVGRDASGQRPRAPSALLLSGGTRAMAMGDAWVGARDAEALFYNPASAGVAAGTAGSLQRFGSASTLGTLTSGMPLGGGGIAIGVRMVDYQGDLFGGVFGPVTRRRVGARPRDLLRDRRDFAQGTAFDASSLAATLAVSKDLFGMRLGVAAKYAEERDLERESTTAFDIGLLKTVGQLSVGLALQDLGRDVKIDDVETELPTRMTLGVNGGARAIGPFDLTAGLALSLDRDGRLTRGTGAELSYEPIAGYAIAFRAGVRQGVKSGAEPLSLGAGLTRDRVSLDYAIQSFGGLGTAHRIGLRVR